MSTTSNNVTLWSKTPGSNTTIDAGINWAEGMSPPAINDSARGMMAAIANWRDDLGAITTTGSANTYVLTTNTGFAALATGLLVLAKINASNSGASTLNVDGLGAKAIRKFTTAGEGAMGSGELQSGGAYLLRYDTALNSAAGGWLCLNPPSATGTTALGGTGRLYGSNTSSSNLTDILIGTGLTMTTATLSNSGVTSIVAGTGISVNASTGAVTITNTNSSSGTVTSVATSNGISGGTITGSGTISMDTNNSVGVGSYCLISNATGSSITNGSTVTTDGTTKTQYTKFSSGNVIANNGAITTGQVWRNVSGTTIANLEFGMFMRVS